MARPLGKGKNDYSYELFFGLDLTDEQETMIDLIFNKKVVFVDAVAGTGKTTIAVGCARLLKDLHGLDCTYVFSPVQEGKLGFRPGTTSDKEADYRQPLIDALIAINENPIQAIYNDDLETNKFANMSAWVKCMSHTFMRGTNLQGEVVIIDEAQNFTESELRKVLTRVDDNCHVIVIGNQKQCDLKDPSQSGFHVYMNHFEEEDYVGICELTHNFRGRIAQKADEL